MSENVRKEKILNEFNSYCKELIVLGFYSAFYNLNLIKPMLIQILLEDIEFVIKRTNSYLCLKTSKLRFLDIKNFLSPDLVIASFWWLMGQSSENFISPTNLWRILINQKMNCPNTVFSILFYPNQTSPKKNTILW